jgi:HD-GYP domain-containing protein (c-di-GMP phosphodiesterase class II)
LRLINIENVTDDMTLAKPIFYKDGSKVLLNIGCCNLQKYKDKLIDMGVHYLYINDNKTNEIEVVDAISEQTRLKSRKIVHDVITSITTKRKFNVVKVKETVETMVEDILKSKSILIGLTDIRTNDDYTFSHSVNVAVLSLVLGKVLHYEKDKLVKLGVGALLHDMGKSMIPPEILNKPGKFTDEEFRIMQEHSQLGFDSIKDSWELSPLSKTIVLCHHEKIDGTGYPRRIKGEDIHEFARIVAICDVFDALTADRCYRKKWPVYQAIEFLMAHVETQFDKNLVEKFLKHVATYPNGSSVVLSDGRKGVISAQNEGVPTRPFVKILEEDGRELKGDFCYTINLMNELAVVIIESE